MKKLFKLSILCVAFITSLTACSSSSHGDDSQTQTESNQESLKSVSFLLDWVPNTNHTGVYVALEKGFYSDIGIDLEVLNPPEESTTALVASNKADFGVSFQDTIATAINSNDDFPVVAIASIIQHNTSGILSLKEAGIDSFKNLEGKTYASWSDPIEQATIKQVMTNQGGDFSKLEIYPSVTTDATIAIQTNVDAVWVYEAWDVMMAEMQGLEYNFIKFSDVEPMLDFYTPVIISSVSYLEENPQLAKDFLYATMQGYEYAIENPKESAEILHKYSPEYDLDMLVKSQVYLAEQYKAEVGQWGYINPERWNAFYYWLRDSGLI
ncbi:MAG: ABC transporter substrate-binding protein, partial [bacterium]